MDGVNILYVESLAASNYLVIGRLVMTMVLILIFGGAALAICIDEEKWLKALGVLVLTLGLIGFFAYGLNSVNKRPDKNYYVTLDANVDVTQFYDKYDVIERKGDIWIVKDKLSD